MEDIKYIKKVEIENLWNKYDIEWNLNEDVNILAGMNGSGKTTILSLIVNIITAKLGTGTRIVDNIKITFNNNRYIIYRKIKDTVQNLVEKSKKDKFIKEYIQEIKQREGNDFKKILAIDGGLVSFENLQITPEEFQKILGISIINTFDQPLKDNESVRKLTDNNINTELDLQIFLLQKKYLEYQLNIGKQAMKLLSLNQKLTEPEVDFKKDLFLDTIDSLFEPTDKKINRNENELVFKLGEQVLTPYMLSSGEKQLIIILLTALIQEDKNFIFFMDEPEVSLHTDWQEKLIGNIRKLNSNAQIIIATHAPSVVVDGWMDKIFEIPEIIIKKR